MAKLNVSKKGPDNISKPTNAKNAPIRKMGQTDGTKYGLNPNVKKG